MNRTGTRSPRSTSGAPHRGRAGEGALWNPPEYPYDRLEPLKNAACAHTGGMIDLSVGTPCDAPPPGIDKALSGSGAEHGYPASVGNRAYRSACASWMHDFLGVSMDPDAIAACVGTKEFVAGLPGYLRRRDPSRDTVLFPELAYPTYAMGAELAGCRAVPVPVDDAWRLDITSVSESDASRALVLWVNSPGNPAGQCDDLAAAASWGRAHGVLVASDECYAAFTWRGRPRTILSSQCDSVIAVHSLSKRSNLAGLRAGFFAGDADVVAYLALVRQHAGLMVPGPVQAAAVVAWEAEDHAGAQRETYRNRLVKLRDLVVACGGTAELPDGGIYIWANVPECAPDEWGFVERLARDFGVLVSPGSFYGDAGRGHVRLAAVQPDHRIDEALKRVGA